MSEIVDAVARTYHRPLAPELMNRLQVYVKRWAREVPASGGVKLIHSGGVKVIRPYVQ